MIVLMAMMMKMIAHISLNDSADVAFESVVLSSLFAARYMVGILAVSPRDLFLAQKNIRHPELDMRLGRESVNDW